MTGNEIGIVKRCPKCNWRILDKVTATTGIIQIKCPKCKNEVKLDLSLRKTTNIIYRKDCIRWVIVNNIASDKYCPCKHKNIIGVFDKKHGRDLVCLIANDDNNFLKEGIVEGSLLFVDRNEEYIDGSLNVFEFNDNREPKYKLSRTIVNDASYIGKVMITMNQYN